MGSNRCSIFVDSALNYLPWKMKLHGVTRPLADETAVAKRTRHLDIQGNSDLIVASVPVGFLLWSPRPHTFFRL